MNYITQKIQNTEHIKYKKGRVHKLQNSKKKKLN